MISSMFKELKEKMEVRMVFYSKWCTALLLYNIFQLNIIGLPLVSITLN